MKNIFLIALISLLMGTSAQSQAPVGSLDPWLNGFKYREAVTFSSGSALTNFQIQFVFDTASLVSAGKMRSDCNDLRVTSADGFTQVAYWTENCNTANTRVWLKQSLAAGSTTYYVYYGNSGASNNANGSNVFELFDDFNGSSIDGSKWTTSGTLRVSGGRVGIDQGASLKSVATFNGAYILEFKQITSSASLRRGTEFGNASTSSFHFTDGGSSSSNNRHSICCWSELDMGSFTTGIDLIWRQIDNSSSMIANIVDPNSYSVLNTPGSFRSMSSGAYWVDIVTYGGGGGVDYYSTDWARVRLYTATEPTASIGSETALVTPTGSATSWTWTTPVSGNSIRSGSATSWVWKSFTDDSTGITVPQGGSTSWTWFP